VCSSDLETLRAEGAKAERERVAGIEAQSLPGHENLVAEMIADGTTTPDQAARRIIEAEKSTRSTQLQAIKDAEKDAKKIDAAPIVGNEGEPNEAEGDTEASWKAAWASNEKLRSQYIDEAGYLAFKHAEASGKVRILGARKSA